MKFLPSDELISKKFALVDKDVVYVSPAIYDLIIHAENDEELTHVLKYVECLGVK